MTIRSPFILVPLIAILIGAWWMLTQELTGKLWVLKDLYFLGASCTSVLQLTLFSIPFVAIWQVTHD